MFNDEWIFIIPLYIELKGSCRRNLAAADRSHESVALQIVDARNDVLHRVKLLLLVELEQDYLLMQLFHVELPARELLPLHA